MAEVLTEEAEVVLSFLGRCMRKARPLAGLSALSGVAGRST